MILIFLREIFLNRKYFESEGNQSYQERNHRSPIAIVAKSEYLQDIYGGRVVFQNSPITPLLQRLELLIEKSRVNETPQCNILQ